MSVTRPVERVEIVTLRLYVFYSCHMGLQGLVGRLHDRAKEPERIELDKRRAHTVHLLLLLVHVQVTNSDYFGRPPHERSPSRG